MIDKAIKDLIAAGPNIEDQGYPPDYVSMNIKQHDDESIKLLQPALIQSIMKNIKIRFKDIAKTCANAFNKSLAACFGIRGF